MREATSVSVADWLPLSGFAVGGALDPGGALLHCGCPPGEGRSSTSVVWVGCSSPDLGAQPSLWAR